MPLSREAFFSLTLCALSASGVAWAQPATNPNDLLAREHFMRGRDTFSQGDFGTAAREFDQAYQLSRRPQLLYNIGTAYERLHNWNEANVAFRRYLDEVPDAPDRAEVEARLRAIEIELQHQAPVNPQETTTRVVVVERPVTAAEPSRTWRTLFWVGGGLTVLSGAGTLAIGLLANQQYNTLASTCGAPRAAGCEDYSLDDIRLRQSIVNGGIAATSVLAAATVVFFVLDLARSQPPAARAQAPSAHAGFVSLPGGGLFTVEGAL